MQADRAPQPAAKGARPPPAFGHRGLRVALALLLLATLWLATRPYYGIVHDAILYLVQALHHLDPATFGTDLYFLYGSQDRFSVISALYAPAVATWGPGGGHLALWAAGQALWVLALALLVWRLFGAGRRAALSAITATAMMPAYTFGMWQYGEPFFTPRLAVEALTGASIALTIANRRLAGLGLMLLGASFHPLIALSGLALWLWLSVRQTARLLGIAGLGGALFLALALSGIDPFGRLLQRMDPHWLAIVAARARQAFVANWAWPSVVFLLLPVFSLSTIIARGADPHRRLALGALGIGGACVAISWLGGDLAANTLILNLQLWRGLWITVFVANCLIPLAYHLLPRGGSTRVLFLAAILVNLAEARLSSGTTPFASGALALACMIAALPRGLGERKPLRLLTALLAAGATLLFPAETAVAVMRDGFAGTLDTALRVAVLGAGAALLTALPRSPARRLPALGGGAALLALATLAITDQQSDRMRFVASDAPLDSRFLAELSGKQVYWEHGLDIVWFRLRQPSFYACYQAAGVMFFRQTALEHDRRARILRHLDTADFTKGGDENCPQRSNPKRDAPVSRAQIEAACRALPELDALVLYADLPDAPHLHWDPGFDIPAPKSRPLPTRPRPPHETARASYNLYRCADFRPG